MVQEDYGCFDDQSDSVFRREYVDYYGIGKVDDDDDSDSNGGLKKSENETSSQTATTVTAISSTITASSPAYHFLLNELLPLLPRLLSDPSPPVRLSASKTLITFSKYIKEVNPNDLGPHILTIALELSHKASDEELRMTASGLLGSLSSIIGR